MEDGHNGPGFGPAVSLTYDGGDPSHLEVALPCLGEFGLRGTFYLPETTLLEAPRAWQAAQNEGHEIGCHSLLEAADGFGNLPKWTLENVEADLREARKLFFELFTRQADFSFAYPGVETECMSVAYDPKPCSYRPVVEKLFQAARSAREGLNDPRSCDLRYLSCIRAEGIGFEEARDAVEAALQARHWAIFAFGGIGSGEGAVDAAAHRELCEWLSSFEDLVRPVFPLALQIEEVRSGAAGAYSWSLGQEPST